MGYKKARIPIRLKGDVVKYVDGYTFEACFSNGRLWLMAVYKNSETHGLWTVTDWHTGYAVCYGKTRGDAVTKFQNTYLSKIERLVFSNEHYSKFGSENWYEAKSREFAESIEKVDA